MGDDGDDSEGQTEEEEPPSVVSGDAAGAMGGYQNDGQDEPVLDETPGVSDEEIDPETPWVGTREDDETSKNGNDPPTLGEMTDQQLPGTGTRYNLHIGRGLSYNHRYTGSDFIVEDENGVVMTMEGTSEVLEAPQMSLEAGLYTFGSNGMKAVEKEMKQLHDRDVMIPVHKKSLTPEQRREALAYLMFLKRKRCGKIKGRGCADGRRQRAYIARKTQWLLQSVLRRCS